jgi:hypothetical protein
VTEEEIRKIVHSISKMLDIGAPSVVFEEYWNGVYLESGLYQGWEYVIFNPNYIKQQTYMECSSLLLMKLGIYIKRRK